MELLNKIKLDSTVTVAYKYNQHQAMWEVVIIISSPILQQCQWWGDSHQLMIFILFTSFSCL